tara:strand:+ start:215 stop:745 length:531 start_codon:yes stop_codon:yes gene_type:complete
MFLNNKTETNNKQKKNNKKSTKVFKNYILTCISEALLNIKHYYNAKLRDYYLYNIYKLLKKKENKHIIQKIYIIFASCDNRSITGIFDERHLKQTVKGILMVSIIQQFLIREGIDEKRERELFCDRYECEDCGSRKIYWTSKGEDYGAEKESLRRQCDDCGKLAYNADDKRHRGTF